MKHLKLLLVGAICLIALALVASDGPRFGAYPQSNYVSAPITAGAEVFAAPGAGYAWSVTAIGWVISTAEADATMTILDDAGTAVNVAIIPLDTALTGYWEFGDGILCSANSAVNVEFSGETGEVAFVVTAHKERRP